MVLPTLGLRTAKEQNRTTQTHFLVFLKDATFGWVAGRASSLKKLSWWVAGMVICLERGVDLHMAQLMPLPLTVSCFSKIQIGFVFLELAYPGSSRQKAVKRFVCVCCCLQLMCN